MQKLALFKLIKTKNGHEILEFCGLFDNQQEVIMYLEEIQKMIDTQFQHQLEGEYFTLPSFYFNLKRREWDTKTQQYKHRD
tara:strand:- start:130 stop:372 length:243 start_codon:yes stop_codon:yes gene_type:complete